MEALGHHRRRADDRRGGGRALLPAPNSPGRGVRPVIALAILILLIGVVWVAASASRSDHALKPGEVERLLKDD